MGSILFVNVLASPFNCLSSYATILESRPPLKNTPIFLLPIEHISTVFLTFFLNSSSLNFLLLVGLMWTLCVCIIFLEAMSYTIVSPASNFLIPVKKVLRKALIPVLAIKLTARLSIFLLLGTLSSIPFISEPNTSPSLISA